MSSTNYDEINKIWYGPKNEFRVNKSDNFGEIVLNKISIENLDRVVQVGLIKSIDILNKLIKKKC